MNVSLIIITKITTGKCKRQRIWTAQTPRTTFSCLFERFSWDINVRQEELLKLQRFRFRLHIRNIRKIWDNLRFPDRPNLFCKHRVMLSAGRAPAGQSSNFAIYDSSYEVGGQICIGSGGGKGGPSPAERSILATPSSELREPMQKPWKSDREKRLKLLGNFFVGFFGCYWGCYWCWSREDITKIDIVHSTVLRAAMTDFIFPKADNISRMSSQRSVFFEGFLAATDPSIQSIN